MKTLGAQQYSSGRARFGSTYTKIGMIQRKLAWPPYKVDTQICEAFHIFKKNAFESVLMRWMKLEPIIQSEVSQKEKLPYSILMHIYGIQKDGNDDPICETAKETQM